MWVLTERVEDQTEGHEIVGLYTSLRKAKQAALRAACLPLRSRAITWEEFTEDTHRGVYVQHVEAGPESDGAWGRPEQDVETWYMAQKWSVR
jgi:hypothetical protein